MTSKASFFLMTFVFAASTSCSDTPTQHNDMNIKGQHVRDMNPASHDVSLNTDLTHDTSKSDTSLSRDMVRRQLMYVMFPR